MVYDLKRVKSRAANAENLRGEQSAGGLAGGGRKGAPCKRSLMPGETYTLMDVEGAGVVRHIWMTFPPNMPLFLRTLILRVYWDGCETAAVEAPVGDFFGIAHARFRPMINEYTSFLNARGLNAWFPMPFRKRARITIENISGERVPMLFYQVDFTLDDELEGDIGYFHAQFKRYTPKIGEDYAILDRVDGPGRFMGCVLGVYDDRRIPGWWGEGEIKMYFDGETAPTICGTGFEDYIGLAWGIGVVNAPEQGCPLADDEDGLYSVYRFHTRDPIYFEKSLSVSIQQMGFGSQAKAEPVLGDAFRRYPAAGDHEHDDMCYYDRADDYCSVAYWYQKAPERATQSCIDINTLTKRVFEGKHAGGIERRDMRN